MTLLGLTLLAALVFYVYNVGDQVNERLVLQNAADAAAVSGAGWMARSANTTAMNNVAISRLLGILPVMDAFPLASTMALEEVTAWEMGISRQLASLRAFLSEYPVSALRVTIPGMEEMRDRMARQREILQPFKEALLDGGFRMEEVTYWRRSGGGGSAPHGTLWQAAKALDDYSVATMDSAGILAQFNARRFGRTNEAETAILIPVIPMIPNYRGEFDDFQPTIEGQITVAARQHTGSMRRSGADGGGIPDFAYYHRLGPWARLLPKDPWRAYYGHFVQTGSRQVWQGPQSGSRGVQARGGRGGLPGRGSSARRGGSGGQQASEGRWVTRPVGYNVTDGYRTRGPYWWAMNRVVRPYTDHHINSKLGDTKFGPYMSVISKIKVGYMFPAAGDKTLQTIHYPDWRTNYDEAKEMYDSDVVRITETMVYFFDIASSVPESSPQFLTPGTFVTNGSLALAARMRGWYDAAQFRPDAQKICDYIWKSTDNYEITEYPEIGIEYEEDAEGNPLFHDVYMVEFCMFGAADVGGDREVRNPCNWQSGEIDELPAPLLIDTSVGDYDSENHDVDTGIRREYFAYLGLARSPTQAPLWTQRFHGVNPTESIHTLSQAKVFNNRSWGLWTQDWQVQLTTLNGYQDWVDRIRGDLEKVSLTQGAVSATELEKILEFLRALDPEFAERFIVH